MKDEREHYRTLDSLHNLQTAALHKSREYSDRLHELCGYLNPDMPNKIFCLINGEIGSVAQKHNVTWNLYLALGKKWWSVTDEPFSYTFKYSNGKIGTGVFDPKKHKAEAVSA